MKKPYYLQVTKSSALQYTGFVNKRYNTANYFFMLEMCESLCEKEEKKLRRFSETVLKCSLVNSGSQVKSIFLTNIKISLFFGVLAVDVKVISNTQTL